MPAAKARKPGKAKQASAETAAAKTLASFAVDCNDVLAFLQAVANSLQAFALAGDLGSPSVISFNLEIAFAPEGEKIRLLITEALLCAASGNLKGSKKQWDWQSLNAVLLPPFLMEVAILHGKSDAGERH